jgi:hypothetical protein
MEKRGRTMNQIGDGLFHQGSSPLFRCALSLLSLFLLLELPGAGTARSSAPSSGSPKRRGVSSPCTGVGLEGFELVKSSLQLLVRL